MEKNTAIWR